MKITCSKCQSDDVRTEYNYRDDILSRLCRDCGWRWNDTPYDRRPVHPDESLVAENGGKDK